MLQNHMFKEGKITTYNENKGYGFIQLEDHEKDLFFHISDFPNKTFPPRIGERLKFRIVSEKRSGACAELDRVLGCQAA